MTGELLALKTTFHLEISSPLMAEAYASLQEVKLGIFLGFQTVDIVGDSKSVIKNCKSATTDKSVLRAIIRDIYSKKPSSLFKDLEMALLIIW